MNLSENPVIVKLPYTPINQSGLMFLFTPSNQILQAYKTDPKMLEMMTNMDFYVTPVLNIDGYIYSWEDNKVSTSI